MNERTENIRRLLALYYSGETTPAQEAELRDFFATSEIPVDMSADAALFRAMTSQPEVPEAVSRRVESVIGTIVAAESRRRHTFGRRIAAFAAGVAVLAAIGIGVYRPAPEPEGLSQEEAHEQVEMAFTLLTSTVKKGCESINSL